jgi:hypothetical protein
MEKTFNTKFGEVTLRGAMIDTDGTNLADGVEIKIDGKLEGETLDMTFGEVEDMSIEEVEKFVEEHCEV